MNKTLKKRNPVFSFLSEYVIIIAIILLAVITAIVNPNFLKLENVLNMIRQMPVLGFVSIGMTLIIIGGYIDLSVAGLFSLVACINGVLVTYTDVGPTVAFLVCLATGVVAGLISFVVFQLCGVDTSAKALFISYGLSTIYSAIAMIVSNSELIQLSKDVWLYGFTSIEIAYIPLGAVLFFICVVLGHLFMKKTVVGNDVYSLGANSVAAKMSGININRSMLVMYVIAGLMTAMGSIINQYRVTVCAPTSGLDFDTNSIMAVVLGGTSLKGGQGSVIRTLMGVAMVTIMSNALIMLNLNDYLQITFKGILMVFAICLDGYKKS